MHSSDNSKQAPGLTIQVTAPSRERGAESFKRVDVSGDADTLPLPQEEKERQKQARQREAEVQRFEKFKKLPEHIQRQVQELQRDYQKIDRRDRALRETDEEREERARQQSERRNRVHQQSEFQKRLRQERLRQERLRKEEKTQIGAMVSQPEGIIPPAEGSCCSLQTPSAPPESSVSEMSSDDRREAHAAMTRHNELSDALMVFSLLALSEGLVSNVLIENRNLRAMMVFGWLLSLVPLIRSVFFCMIKSEVLKIPEEHQIKKGSVNRFWRTTRALDKPFKRFAVLLLLVPLVRTLILLPSNEALRVILPISAIFLVDLLFLVLVQKFREDVMYFFCDNQQPRTSNAKQALGVSIALSFMMLVAGVYLTRSALQETGWDRWSPMMWLMCHIPFVTYQLHQRAREYCRDYSEETTLANSTSVFKVATTQACFVLAIPLAVDMLTDERSDSTLSIVGKVGFITLTLCSLLFSVRKGIQYLAERRSAPSGEIEPLVGGDSRALSVRYGSSSR